jgi:hypothetical protein
MERLRALHGSPGVVSRSLTVAVPPADIPECDRPTPRGVATVPAVEDPEAGAQAGRGALGNSPILAAAVIKSLVSLRGAGRRGLVVMSPAHRDAAERGCAGIEARRAPTAAMRRPKRIRPASGVGGGPVQQVALPLPAGATDGDQGADRARRGHRPDEGLLCQGLHGSSVLARAQLVQGRRVSGGRRYPLEPRPPGTSVRDGEFECLVPVTT